MSKINLHKSVVNIEISRFPDGVVKYKPKGQKNFDTCEVLERDSLIRRWFDQDGEHITIFDPCHPRVVCCA